MPIKSKWILTFGILAMSPNLVLAGPFGLSNPFSSSSTAEKAEASSSASKNQQVAEQIAAQLSKAKLVGYDISIEYQNGVATLTGKIKDAAQKEAATEAVRALPDVKRVDNQMKLMTPSSSSEIQQTAFQPPVRKSAGIEQAGFEAPEQKPAVSPIQQVAGTSGQSEKARNQQVANQIAHALKGSGASGYDLEVSYKDGVAGLKGSVRSPQERQHIASVVSSVPGVQKVDNQLSVAQQGAPVQQTAAFDPQQAYTPSEAAPAPASGPQGGPAMGYPGMGHPGMPPGGPGMMPPGPAPHRGHPGPGPVSPVYNQPHLPDHAWPTYAAYPNYGAVSYPKQYSASAFPYIGPFYPYPQVPMGWRSSTLEWDDGQWQLKFSPQTERWWWFMNPKNWD